MKTFFGGVFIDNEKLKRNGIDHPIKIEYYKITNETKENSKQYGIQIIKKEYIGKRIETEEKEIKGMLGNEENIEKILKILKNNEVTPISCDDVLNDLIKQSIYKYDLL